MRRLRYLDAVARHTARNNGKVEQIVLDLDKSTIWVQETMQSGNSGFISGDSSDWVQRLPLPEGFRLEQVWMANGEPNGQTSGTWALPVSADGYTPSYGVQLGYQSQSGKRWLVFAGLTGEPYEASDSRQVQSILGSIAPPELEVRDAQQ